MSKQDLRVIINRITHIERNHLPVDPILNVRHASVAAIIRWKPYEKVPQGYTPSTLANFLNEPWVNDCHGEAQIIFIQRAIQVDDPWSGQVGFPGGKNEPSDKDHVQTAIRECKEEIGLGLDSDAFIHLGTLDPRSITRYDDNSEIMLVLYPQVFLQVTPETPLLSQPNSEVTNTMWVSLRYLLTDPVVPFDAITSLNDKVKQFWGSSVMVPAIHLKQTENGPYLWGITLRITQEILGLSLSKNTVVTTLKDEDMDTHKTKQKGKL